MTSNSTKKSFAAFTARLLVMLVAVCLVLAVAPRLAAGFLPVASADPVRYEVPAGTAPSTINSTLNGYASGTVVNMVLQGDIDLSSGGITIPSGLTVNLYMNGQNMTYSNNSWQLTGFAAITNNGTLNIYSGSSASTPDLSGSTASISLTNNRTEMNISQDEKAYARLEGIVNNGTLSVNKNVAVNIINYVGYKDQSAERGPCTVAATGIYNTSSSAVCQVNAAKIEVLAQAHAITERTSNDIDHGRAFSYGIYGGTVSVAGDTDIHTNAYARMACANTAAWNNENGCLITVAYNIVSNGNITVTGGNFRYDTSHACNKAVTDKGSSWCYQGGICYSGAAPTIADGTFSTPSGSTGLRGNSKTYREAIVTYASVLPYSGYDLFCNNSTPGTTYGGVYNTYNEPAYPTNGVSAGTYKDEIGNTYSSSMTTSDGTHPSAVIRGAVSGYTRVHLVYRYWTDSSKESLDQNIIGSTGAYGYTYKPQNDTPRVLSETVTLSGLSGNKLIKAVADNIRYSSGGALLNANYWVQYNLAHTSSSAWFSDYDVASSSGSVFMSFDGTQNESIGANSSAPIYVFVDYYRKAPTGLKGAIGNSNANTVSTTFTGSPILASAINLKVKSGAASGVDLTEEYDLDCADISSKIPVSYHWRHSGETDWESTDGTLPVDAGVYTVSLNVADSTAYHPDPQTHKNRRALSYEFTLTINPAPVTRGTLPESVTLTYGTKLNEAMTLAGYVANGFSETVPGAFSFTNGSSDGGSYKHAGSGTVSITWTPGSGVTNYCISTFTVAYTVEKASLTIWPKAATVQYGLEAFAAPSADEPYDGILLEGLVGNESTEAAQASAVRAVERIAAYRIKNGGSWVVYVPGAVGMGSYPIAVSFKPGMELPRFMDDYTYAFADVVYGESAVNQLEVTVRDLIVTATAVSRPYDPDNYSVEVTYEVTEGRFGQDDVRFTSSTGVLSNNNAGTQTVGDVGVYSAAEHITGSKSGSYQVAQVLYATGDTLTVEITRATPSVNTPVVADMYYKRARTLADVPLTSSGASMAGEWYWETPTVNPTVAVSAYRAKFVPENTNYDVKYVDVAITVRPTPVTVTYNGTVQYGDPKPNITAYQYASSLDDSFDISYVNTTGNINPSTDYTPGSPVRDGGYNVILETDGYSDLAGNYTFSVVNGKITVTPREIVFTVQNRSVEYGESFLPDSSTVILDYDESRLVGDDTLNNITATGADPVWNYTSSFDAQTAFGVGTYTLNATPGFNTSANYSVRVVNGTLTVTKAPLTIKANNVTLAYNSELPANLTSTLTLVGAKRNERLSDIVAAGSVTVSTEYHKGSPVTEAGYPVTVKTDGVEIPNYVVTVEHGSITVIKATPTITTLPSASIVYGQTLADAVFTGAVIADDVPGSFVYNNPAIQPSYSATPYNNYYATFIPDDTNNYNSVGNKKVPLTVNKMPVSGALAVSGLPMVGQTLSVDVSGMTPDQEGVYAFSWQIDGVEKGVGTTFALTAEYEQKSLTVVATAQGFYEGSASYTIPIIAPVLTDVNTIINASDYSDTFTLEGLTAGFGETTVVTYNAEQKEVLLRQKESTITSKKVGAITVKYNGSTEIPVNAGLYRVTVDVATPDLTQLAAWQAQGATIYSPAAGIYIGTLQIDKAPYHVTVTVADKEYDGYNTAFAGDIVQSGAMTLPGGMTDDVAYDAARAIYTFADADVSTTGKAVAVGNAALTGSAAGNYALDLTLANGATASITPRTLNVRVVPVSREYLPDTYDVDLSFVVDVTSLAPADNTSSVSVDNALAKGLVANCNAGERAVTVSDVVLTGPKRNNYVLNLTNLEGLTVVIEKATPFYPLPYTSTVYYDSARRLSDISLGDDRWAWADDVANVVPQAGTRSYTAIYTPAGDEADNYATVAYEVSLTVRKKDVTVQAASFQVVYGEYAPTYYYNVTGLTGNDTLQNAVSGYAIMSCGYSAGSDVNNYPIVLDGEFTSNNYNFHYVNGEISVTRRPINVTAVAESRVYQPGNVNVNVTFSALENIYAGDESNVYLNGTMPIVGTMSNANAGMKLVNYDMPELAGAKAGNYTLSLRNPELMVEIVKATPDGVVLPTSGTVKYGEKLSTTVFTSAYVGEDGAFSMENPTSTPAAVGVTSNVYKVMFTPTDSVNYATVSGYITLTVTTADLNVELNMTGSAEVGKKLYVSTNSLPADAYDNIEFKWYRMNSSTGNVSEGTLVAAGTTEYTCIEKDADHYIVCVAVHKSGSPYNINARVSTDGTVSKKSMTLWERLLKWFYRVIASLTQLFGRI